MIELSPTLLSLLTGEAQLWFGGGVNLEQEQRMALK